MTADSVTRQAKWSPLAWFLVAVLVLAVLAANAHLVYVAVASQPGCVAHRKGVGTQAGEYRAAKPAC